MAPLPSPLSLRLNSLLKLLLTTPHTLTPSCLIFKSFVIMFLMPWLALTLGRRMVLMESFLLFSKTVLLCSHLVRSNFFVSAYQLQPILLAGSMLTYNLFQRRVTAPIPQTTILLLWFPAVLKSWSLSLTERFRGIYPLTTFYLIVSMYLSMATDLDTLLAIFWLFLLTSHPLLRVTVKRLLLP